MPRALIPWGGWEGHHPREVAALFSGILSQCGFDPVLIEGTAPLEDPSLFSNTALVVPVITMGNISQPALRNLVDFVTSGGGLAGVHGGMCDSFRGEPAYHFLTGGQWVAHPGDDNVRYRVRVTAPDHPIFQGIPDFDVCSEQYYLHVDPANKVLAVTRFPVADGPHVSNGPVDMPVAWTRYHGQGRVFYLSLGHSPGVLQAAPVPEIIKRGFLWAAGHLE